MTREEKLYKLYQTKTRVELTDLTSEMAYECLCINSRGYQYNWIAYDSWPAIEIKGILENQFMYIQEKVKAGALQIEDIKGTQLYRLYRSFFQQDRFLNDFFSDMCRIDSPIDRKIYGLIGMHHNDEGVPRVSLYTDYEKFVIEFEKNFITNITSWESMSDDELDEWIERIEEFVEVIPCAVYDEE